MTPIRIRKDVPKWARQVVSLRNEFPRDSEYQSIMALLRSKNMPSSTKSTDEIVMISVPRSMSRRVVFAFTSEDGKLREVFEADRK